jgi:hypothetical protein
MLLKQQDVKTFENYKKAMRMSASQIKDDTKFCIYTEVQLPDASGKMHILKPFLVVGNGQSTFKPLLPLLKGGKRFICEGTCSLHEGKVTLQGDKVPFGQLKRQATFFKELMGKPMGIPTGTREEDDDEEEMEAKPPATQPGPSAPLKPPAGNIAASMVKQPVPPPAPQATPQAARTVPPALSLAAASHPVRLANASNAWHGTRGIVDGKCKELKQAIRAHYGKSHPEVIKEIENNMHKIDAIVGRLDHTLAVSLKKASAAPSDAARTAELRVARGILNEYIRYAKSEPLIAQIDRNPFGVKCKLRQVLAESLTHMSQTITA